MVKARENLTGKIFGRLKVLEQAEDYISPKTQRHYSQWLCECSCEKHTHVIVLGTSLKKGITLSCGCYNKEILSTKPRKIKGNKYDEERPGVGYCSNTGREFYFDVEDFDKIKKYTWYEHHKIGGYCAVQTRDPATNKRIKMSHLVTNTVNSKEIVEHIDRDPFNNKKSNLRPATHEENARNRSLGKNNKSGFIGVHFDADRNKWVATITINNRNKVLGWFKNKDDAIKARLQAEKDHYGEFAPQQHLYDQYNIN